ncbi:MAG: hypothetical protein Q7T78_21360 [Rhodoferax sp.]|nr:hypothetical protein [Rhodoferax sp.]
MTHFAAPVHLSNRIFQHTPKLLKEKALCVRQICAVLHYFLRTQSGAESKRAGNSRTCGVSRTAWHTQNRPEPRATRGNPRNDKANREQLALNFGGLGPYRKTDCKPRRHWVSGFFENSGYKPGYNRSIVVFLRFFGLEPLTNSSRIESTKTVVLDILVRRVTNHERIKRRVM